jgi:hypothetical protein
MTHHSRESRESSNTQKKNASLVLTTYNHTQPHRLNTPSSSSVYNHVARIHLQRFNLLGRVVAQWWFQDKYSILSATHQRQISRNSSKTGCTTITETSITETSTKNLVHVGRHVSDFALSENSKLGPHSKLCPTGWHSPQGTTA